MHLRHMTGVVVGVGQRPQSTDEKPLLAPDKLSALCTVRATPRRSTRARTCLSRVGMHVQQQVSKELGRFLILIAEASSERGRRDASMKDIAPQLLRLRNTSILVPVQAAMTVLLPSTSSPAKDHRPFPSLVTIECTRVSSVRHAVEQDRGLMRRAMAVRGPTAFGDYIYVFSSLARPKKVSLLGSDGRQYHFVCKPKDDLRKDSRVMELHSVVNKLFNGDPTCRRRSLCTDETRMSHATDFGPGCGRAESKKKTTGVDERLIPLPICLFPSGGTADIRTYSVMPLNGECGFLEWVYHSLPLKANIDDLELTRHTSSQAVR